MLPSIDLTQRYGTGDADRNREVVEGVSKLAVLGALARIAGALGQKKIVENDLARQHEEAEMLNERAQEVEAAYIGQATQPLRYTRPPAIIPANMSQYYPVGLDQGMVRIASAIGADMASMDKEAISFAGFGQMAKGFGGAMAGVARGTGNALKGGAMRMSQAAKAAPGNALSKANNWAANQGAKMQNWGNNFAAKASQPATAAKAPTMAMNTGQVAAAPKQTIPAAPLQANANTTTGAAAKAQPGFLQRSGLFNQQGQLRTGKLLAGGALLGAGYLGYKGLKSGLNYMTGHSPPASYNLGGNQVPMGVNEYGQPQFGLPG